MHESTVSRNIKNFRDQKCWSQQQLADELNRSRGTISKWETDKETPNMEALIHLSSIFEVSIDYLVGNHHHQEEYVKEFNRLYQLQKTDNELLEVVDYLKQNPKFKKSLHMYTKLNVKYQKTIEKNFRSLVEDLS